MTTEEKARAYDEALERAKKEWSDNLDGAYTNYRERLEFIFPELKENEDERIRKSLITFLQRFPYENLNCGDLSSSEAIAWLEKQKPVEFCEEDERVRSAISIYLDWLDGRKDCSPRGEYSIRDMVVWLEKQGEQKSFDYENANIRQNDFAPKTE